MSKKTTSYERFPLARRIEHVIMMLSFSLLGLTGLPQRYPLADASTWFVNLLGGIENLRAVHHVSATVMMFGTAWHILIAGYKIFVLREKMSMLPAFQDAKDGIQALMYNVGLGKKPPQMGRYTFEEKLEYWAFVWGAIVMGLSGFLMWNPVLAAKFLPGDWIPAAKAAHSGEALLAVAAIILWHFYGVHIKNFNKSMWTGKMSEEEMLHEHPLELADLKAGLDKRPVSPEVLRKRKAIYYPIATVLTIVMLAGVYGFVNSEETALTTVPPQPEQPAVYVPQTPTPVPTKAPSEASVSVPELLAGKCGACHGEGGMAELNLSSYDGIMQGGKSGAAVVPGDGANSFLVTFQQKGGHPGQLSADEITLLQDWIDAGALEE